MISKMGKWMFSTKVPGKLEIHMLKNEAENLPLTIYKNYLQTHERVDEKAQSNSLESSDLNHVSDFWNPHTSRREQISLGHRHFPPCISHTIKKKIKDKNQKQT